MFQGLLWPHLRPSPAPRPTSREVARAALDQPPRPGAAGAEHPGALAVPRPGPRGGPARGLLPGPRLSLCCPESGGTGRVLAACRLPAKSWEPGEQADPWDQEPAAFPAPPTHSPGPALPAGLWGRQPAQPCPQASLLGGGGAWTVSLPKDGVCMGPRRWGGSTALCTIPSASRAVRGPGRRALGLGSLVPQAPLFFPAGGQRRRCPLGVREPLGGRALSPALSPRGRAPQQWAGRVQHLGVHGSQTRRGAGCQVSCCGKQGGGGRNRLFQP